MAKRPPYTFASETDVPRTVVARVMAPYVREMFDITPSPYGNRERTGITNGARARDTIPFVTANISDGDGVRNVSERTRERHGVRTTYDTTRHTATTTAALT